MITPGVAALSILWAVAIGVFLLAENAKIEVAALLIIAAVMTGGYLGIGLNLLQVWSPL